MKKKVLLVGMITVIIITSIGCTNNINSSALMKDNYWVMISNDTKVKDSPNSSSDTTMKLTVGEAVVCSTYNTDWLYYQSGNFKGYILKKDVSIID